MRLNSTRNHLRGFFCRPRKTVSIINPPDVALNFSIGPIRVIIGHLICSSSNPADRAIKASRSLFHKKFFRLRDRQDRQQRAKSKRAQMQYELSREKVLPFGTDRPTVEKERKGNILFEDATKRLLCCMPANPTQRAASIPPLIHFRVYVWDTYTKKALRKLAG